MSSHTTFKDWRIVAVLENPNDARDPDKEPGSGERAEHARLLEVIRQLQDAVLARDEFISMIGHEMRNPMTPLLMQASSLLLLVRDDTNLPERVVRSIELLNAIVEDFMRRATVLLDISRMNAGIYRLERSRIDWSAILHGVLQRMSVQFTHAGAAVHCHIEEGIFGHWDPLALEQIADNLLSNAIKYGENRPVQLTLRREEAHAVFTVRDSGSGISEENRQRIFARFERAVTMGRASGFGVGLWLVGRLVNEMGGSIEVESAPAQGSAFSVRLPMDCAGGEA